MASEDKTGSKSMAETDGSIVIEDAKAVAQDEGPLDVIPLEVRIEDPQLQSERIEVLQEKIKEVRRAYMNLMQKKARIDKRREKLRQQELRRRKR